MDYFYNVFTVAVRQVIMPHTVIANSLFHVNVHNVDLIIMYFNYNLNMFIHVLKVYLIVTSHFNLNFTYCYYYFTFSLQ